VAKATLVEVMRYFGIPIATFRKEWEDMTATDKEQLQVGIGNGTLTY
jgi:hypothetical protein